MSVQRLDRGEAANIKRLEEVGRVGWHTQRNNLIVCIKLIKLWCSIAPMPIKDEQPLRTNYTRLCMSVKVLYLLKT
jgi:hypothetical protein